MNSAEVGGATKEHVRAGNSTNRRHRPGWEDVVCCIFLQMSAYFGSFDSSATRSTVVPAQGWWSCGREAAASVHRWSGRPSAEILTEGNQRLFRPRGMLRSCAAHFRSAAPCVHVGLKLLFCTFAHAKRGQLLPLSAFHLALAFAVISRF